MRLIDCHMHVKGAGVEWSWDHNDRIIEAADALGLDYWKSMRLVILPQAILKVIPPIGNQLVILIKDTSLVSAIGVAELTMTGKMLLERSAASFEIFILIAIIYLAITSLFGVFLRFFETHYRARQ